MRPDGDRAAAGEAQATTPGGQARPGSSSAAPSPSWWSSLQDLVHELPRLVSDRVDLLSLELQRAGQVLGRIVVLLIAASILAATAWVALCAGVLLALIGAGVHWGAAWLLVLVVNLGACTWAVVRVRALAPMLQMPATRRHLTLAQPSNDRYPPSTR